MTITILTILLAIIIILTVLMVWGCKECNRSDERTIDPRYFVPTKNKIKTKQIKIKTRKKIKKQCK